MAAMLIPPACPPRRHGGPSRGRSPHSRRRDRRARASRPRPRRGSLSRLTRMPLKPSTRRLRTNRRVIRLPPSIATCLEARQVASCPDRYRSHPQKHPPAPSPASWPLARGRSRLHGGGRKAALPPLSETLYPTSMDEPWNPVIVGVSCAAGITAIVAACKIIGIEAPLAYGTAAVGGMFVGGLAAIVSNLLAPKR